MILTKRLTFLLFVFSNLIFSQVGIGTTTPKSSLDIAVPDSSNPSNTDGLLIPRINVFPTINPTITQQGMLVYLSTPVGVNPTGFYYWNNPTTTWINISGVVKTYIEDSDADTKIQVEESTDEDIIRFDMAGTEYFRMESGRLKTINTGGSVIIGENAGLNDDLTGRKNVYVGDSAGKDNVRGYENVAIGASALTADTDGFNNVAIGTNALLSSIGGVNNVAIGKDALSSTIGGHDNVAIGTDALKGNTGDTNVGIGQWAGRNNTGYRNIFIGHGAGNGSGNVSNRLFIDMAPSSFPLIYGEFDNELLRIYGTLDIMGQYQFPTVDGTSGQALTTDGSGNVSWMTPVTSTVLQDTDGDTKIQVEESTDEDIIRFDIAGVEHWSMVGSRLEANNTGNSVFIGEGAGASDDLSNNKNIFTGYRAGYSTTTGTNNLATGHQALYTNYTGNNNIAMGYQVLYDNENGSNNIGLGNGALYDNRTGGNNVAMGYQALNNNSTSSNNIAIGYHLYLITIGKEVILR